MTSRIAARGSAPGSVADLVAVVLLAAAFAGASAALATASEATPSALQVMVVRGLVTLDVRDARLEDVLRALAAHAGFDLELRGHLSTTVTRSFTDVPLERAIQRLARGQSLGFVYAPDADTGGLRLSELWVIASASAPAAVTRRTGAERAAQLRQIGALGARRDNRALEELAGLLSGDADPFVRARAAATLSRTRQPAASRPLEAALDDGDASVRVQALRGLVLLEREGAVDAVARLLLNDPDARVRRAAAYSLAALQSESARAALQAATVDADAFVRRAASAALMRSTSRTERLR